MIKLLDIYTAVNQLLKTKYPTYKIHGHKVIEGFSTPSFFVDLIPVAMSNETYNYKRYAYTIQITYFQKTVNEIDNLQKIDEIQDLFGYKLAVLDRKITVTDFDYNFVGDNTNRLQFLIDIEFYQQIERQDKHVPAQELIFEREVL